MRCGKGLGETVCGVGEIGENTPQYTFAPVLPGQIKRSHIERDLSTALLLSYAQLSTPYPQAATVVINMGIGSILYRCTDVEPLSSNRVYRSGSRNPCGARAGAIACQVG